MIESFINARKNQVPKGSTRLGAVEGQDSEQAGDSGASFPALFYVSNILLENSVPVLQ